MRLSISAIATAVFILSLAFPKEAHTYSLSDSNAAFEKEMNLPKILKNEKEAHDAGCTIVKLKQPNLRNCVIYKNQFHGFTLTIYDENSKKQFQKDQQLCIESWYGGEKVKYEDILGIGTQSIIIETEGNNKHTDTNRLILLAWHNNRFKTLLFELVGSHIAGGEHHLGLDVKYKFNKNNNGILAFNMSSKYYEGDDSERYFEASWVDKFIFDKTTFTFYKKEDECDKLRYSPFIIQSNIAKVRLIQLSRDTDISEQCKFVDIGQPSAINHFKLLIPSDLGDMLHTYTPPFMERPPSYKELQVYTDIKSKIEKENQDRLRSMCTE